MKNLLAAAVVVTLSSLPTQAQDVEAGAALYDLHCATCHGLAGRGNGPLAPALLLQPSVLRTLAQRKGSFPMERVVSRIDGRDPLVSHGSPMPVYGPFFEGAQVSIETEDGGTIETSKPVADLVAYLQSIQE